MRTPAKHTPLLAALILLAAFWMATYHIQRESLWYDEGWTMWAVHDEAPQPVSVIEAVQYVRHSLTDTLARVRDDVHPPLYFLALDVWVMLVGESVFAVRLLSTLFGLLALAGTYVVGARLFDHRVGLVAMIVLGTASFFVYYTREARMYTLLVVFSALATWAYLRWLRNPSARWAGLYGLVMAALLYTHYVGVVIVVTHALHLVLSLRLRIRIRHALPFVIALLVYAPWLPVLLNQVRVNNGRPLADALPTDWGAVAALWLIVTSGSWGQYALPFVFWRRVKELPDRVGDLALLALWFLVTPAALLALNAWVTPIFQIRYNIAILPAGALIMAWGLRHVRLPGRLGMGAARLLALFLLCWLAYTQLAMYTEFWPDKSRWGEAVAQMTAARQPLEPVLIDISPSSAAAYYDRQYRVRQGITLDVSWREHTPEEMRALIQKLDSAPSIWAVMRSDMPSTWDAVASLDANRTVGYRDSVMNLVLYRFDTASQVETGLQFRFGDVLRYESGIGHQFYAQRGATFCLPIELNLTAVQPLADVHQIHVYFTQGYNALRASWQMDMTQLGIGEQALISPCFDIAADEPPGPHYLRMVITQGHQRLPLIEGPPDSALYWGTELMLATVSVE